MILDDWIAGYKFANRLLDVEPGKLCYFIGTVYIDMPLKPSVLDEIGNEYNFCPPPPREKIFSDKDTIVIEDESGRIVLIGDFLKQSSFVTGTIVGVFGRETLQGEFETVGVCYPESTQLPLPLPTNEPKWLALVSGLNIGNPSTPLLRTSLLFSYLSGNHASISPPAHTITRLILSGNQITKPVLIPHLPTETQVKRIAKKEFPKYDSGPIKTLDGLLAGVCESLEVDVMPGKNEPTNFSLPQQPLHGSMFQDAGCYSSFHSVSNPYAAMLDTISFVGVSGQNLDDVYRYIDGEDRIDMAASTLLWAHVAPTAPDTLRVYPFTDSDPFILETRPHIYFVGNQPKFETKLVEENGMITRIVLIPVFSETGCLVLVNLETLEVKTVVFE